MLAQTLINNPYLTLLSIAVLILHLLLIFTILIIVTSVFFLLHRRSKASTRSQREVRHQRRHLKLEVERIRRLQLSEYAF